MTQNEKILIRLKIYGSISPREAIDYFNCYRLAARIRELRAKYGQDAIETVKEKHRGGTHARYYWRLPQSEY